MQHLPIKMDIIAQVELASTSRYEQETPGYVKPSHGHAQTCLVEFQTTDHEVRPESY